MADDPQHQVATNEPSSGDKEMKGNLVEENQPLEVSTSSREAGRVDQEPSVDTASPAQEVQKEAEQPAEHTKTMPSADGESSVALDEGNSNALENEETMKVDAQQAHQQELDRLLWLSLPGNDQAVYYSDSDEDDHTCISISGPSQYTNRGRKLHAKDGARWAHRGKLGTWTEPRKEAELNKREHRKLDAFQHANVDALLETESLLPGGMGNIWRENVKSKRPSTQPNGARKQSRTRAWNPRSRDELIGSNLGNAELSSLNGSSMALPMLVPVLSARELLQSKLLKQTFRNPHLTALNRTALNLLESEHTMNCALGRCFSTMERMFDGPLGEQDAETSKHNDPPMDIVPPLVHINDLFITKEGLHVPTGSSTESDTTTLISVEEQREILHSSLESLNELYADSREYMEQLEEVRLLLADVRRNRTHMWDIMRRWALRRENQDYQASQQYRRSRSDLQKNDYGSKPYDESTQSDGIPNTNEARGNQSRRDWNSPSSRSRGKKRSGR